MAEIDVVCRVCEARTLDEFAQFRRLPRVTSDCRPFPVGGRLAICGVCAAVQKPVDARWQEEAAAIYAAYDVYFQSDGIEQAVFDAATGAPRRRSAVLLDRLAASRPIAAEGRLLDVGCGNGALLSSFAGLRPGWRLYGHDLSEINHPALARIAGFEELYTCPADALPGGFDLVSLSHSLEHFTNPVEDLASLRSKLAADGCLFIEVPDAEATPFDLLIADHVSHFTADDMARVLARAGFDLLILARDSPELVKELSVVAEGAPARRSTATADDARRQRRRTRFAAGSRRSSHGCKVSSTGRGRRRKNDHSGSLARRLRRCGCSGKSATPSSSLPTRIRAAAADACSVAPSCIRARCLPERRYSCR